MVSRVVSVEYRVWFSRTPWRVRLWAVVIAGLTLLLQPAAATQSIAPKPGLSVKITSPLGRTGTFGPVRIVARVTSTTPEATLGPVKFYVDGALVGEDTDGRPYAIEWIDENPFAPREISVQVEDSLGETARDVYELKPLIISDEGAVFSVRLETAVVDPRGRYVAGLVPADFRLLDNGESQALDVVTPDDLPQTYTLLVDSSYSMKPRMTFVRDAARLLAQNLVRPSDSVMVAPFTVSLGTITEPTKDHEVVTRAVNAIVPTGGTAILDSLAALTGKLGGLPGPHVIVLITDGYDETSLLPFDKVLEAVQATKATVYVIGINGDAGISTYGKQLLLRLATETGGLAFFPKRNRDLPGVHALIAADVQQRYLIAYTPNNQTPDGAWHAVTLKTTNPSYSVQVRAGYRSPDPPPIVPSIELTIRDLNRQYVDVSPDDLIVLEDGVEQKIEAFEEALTPVSIVLTLDASGSMKKATDAVVEAARSFVRALPARDSLAVMQFADAVVLTHDFSTDREAGLESIGQYVADGGTALYDALNSSLVRLKDIKGRRAIVVLTDGRDENNPGTAAGSASTLDDVLANAKTVGAAVFAIGLGPRVDRAPLERLAQMSGGETYFPDDVSSLGADYHRILENLRRRYIIRYASTNLRRDGAWRKVEIRGRHDGIVVESKAGYFAPGKGSPDHR